MDVILSFILCFIFLIISVYKKIYILYPLILCLIIFILLSFKKGFTSKNIYTMCINGVKKTSSVVITFLLIGSIIGIWMASATVPAIVYYSINFISPNLFILSCFLICCIVSFLIGTSSGTTGTAGIALMAIARSGGINPIIAAGAIISGIYFGDRCSPVSSGAHLIVELTETDIHTNTKNMFKTSLIPFSITVLIYTIISYNHPLKITSTNILMEIESFFTLNYIVLIPVALIIFLSLSKINMRIAMMISILSSFLISVYIQKNSFIESFKYIIFGFDKIDHGQLSNIFYGGGITSMLRLCLVILISSAMAGIFNETGMLKDFTSLIYKAKNRSELFLGTILTSILTSAFGCNQVLAIVLTDMFVKDGYNFRNIDKYDLATDLENTSVLIAPLLPWNTALFLSTSILGVDYKVILYAFYLYLVPLVNLIFLFIKDNFALSNSISCNSKKL
ncbi:Na+/H+ antiporter NhaC family protein [Clostridium sp. MSJ-11]|uniref:Na+/H+ antiporter NhaC family protein n=1 Tax=Clostridium mobile TaxID=2841512 RepID=A0ABS6ELW4_9CLOT|nr:Na+/H+ antiporter NhaC family protein [Clostridium mobile]MBU5486226.1 Na+/H+ antiporter NhaC family protein [Clostridium mobile]